jgi:hypothetical protein
MKKARVVVQLLAELPPIRAGLELDEPVQRDELGYRPMTDFDAWPSEAKEACVRLCQAAPNGAEVEWWPAPRDIDGAGRVKRWRLVSWAPAHVRRAGPDFLMVWGPDLAMVERVWMEEHALMVLAGAGE